MPKKKKKEPLTVTVKFVDNDGKLIGTDPKEVLSTLSQEQLNRNLALLQEAITGIKHKPGK